MKRFKYLLTISLLIGAGLIFYLQKDKFESGPSEIQNLALIAESFDSTSLDVETDKNGEAVSSETPPAFSINYPKDFVVRRDDSDSRLTRFVFESSEEKRGFEISVFPFDETEPLTFNRIKKDLADPTLSNDGAVKLGDIETLVFDSTDENIGPTRELWFSTRGYLFQFRTYKEFGKEMEIIAKTFLFR